jgi:tryptophan-rich sensory protein
MSLSIKILIAIAACVILGGLSGAVTVNAIQTWYVTLNKPSWNPPNWLFGPVWTTLYVLMGVAFGLVWHSSNEDKDKAMFLFYIQFGLNMLWSLLFFYFKSPGLALIEIVLMLAFILLTTNAFKKIEPRAAYLLFPYIAWVSFATFLNFTIWKLN